MQLRGMNRKQYTVTKIDRKRHWELRHWELCSFVKFAMVLSRLQGLRGPQDVHAAADRGIALVLPRPWRCFWFGGISVIRLPYGRTHRGTSLLSCSGPPVTGCQVWSQTLKMSTCLENAGAAKSRLRFWHELTSWFEIEYGP